MSEPATQLYVIRTTEAGDDERRYWAEDAETETRLHAATFYTAEERVNGEMHEPAGQAVDVCGSATIENASTAIEKEAL